MPIDTFSFLQCYCHRDHADSAVHAHCNFDNFWDIMSGPGGGNDGGTVSMGAQYSYDTLIIRIQLELSCMPSEGTVFQSNILQMLYPIFESQ